MFQYNTKKIIYAIVWIHQVRCLNYSYNSLYNGTLGITNIKLDMGLPNIGMVQWHAGKK